MHPRLVTAARAALGAGAPVLTDAHMIPSGVTRARLPRDNEVICTLRDERVPALAAGVGNHALRRCRLALGRSARGRRRRHRQRSHRALPPARADRRRRPGPAAIVGIPVGFIGSAESKVALADNPFDIPWLVVHGRRGGSALAASAVNALAREEEL